VVHVARLNGATSESQAGSIALSSRWRACFTFYRPCRPRRLSVAALRVGHAVEIDPMADRSDEIERRPHAHQVARPIRRHLRRHSSRGTRYISGSAHPPRIAGAIPSNAPSIDVDAIASRCEALDHVRGALNDAESCLSILALCSEICVPTTWRATALDHAALRTAGRTLVERHRDVGADCAGCASDLRRQRTGSVRCESERHAVVVDAIELRGENT
jgi:hypothetical protein